MYQKTKMVSILLETFQMPLYMAVVGAVSFMCVILLMLFSIRKSSIQRN